jgi:hypothetical protein
VAGVHDVARICVQHIFVHTGDTVGIDQTGRARARCDMMENSITVQHVHLIRQSGAKDHPYG